MPTSNGTIHDRMNKAAAGEADPPRPSIASLVDRLVQDFKALLAHEFRLAREEVRLELAKAKTVAIGTAAGAAIGAVGGLLLVLTLVHMLHELAGLPLWAAYGIVGLVLFAVAGVLVWRARRAAAAFHLVPEHTVQTVKENFTWLKEQTTLPRS